MDTTTLMLIVGIFALLLVILLAAMKWGSADQMIYAIAFSMVIVTVTMCIASRVEPEQPATDKTQVSIVQTEGSPMLKNQ